MEQFANLHATRLRNTMCVIPVLACALGLIGCARRHLEAKASPPVKLESLYIGVEALSDAAPFFYEYLLEATPVTGGTSLRLIRVASTAVGYCPGLTVKAFTRTVPESVSELAGRSDLCSLSNSRVAATLARFPSHSAIDDTVRFGVVAKCGTAENAIFLPYEETVQRDRLKRAAPEISSLYDLNFDIRKRVFGDADFYGIRAEEDLGLQRTAEPFISELRSGKFDRGFQGYALSVILQDYRGIVPLRQPVPKLVAPKESEFEVFASPAYPPLARQARIQGEVELEIELDSESGLVRSVKALSGHPLLQQSAIAAAKQWKYDVRRYPGVPTIHVVLNYSLECE